jgi:hypothetical protein
MADIHVLPLRSREMPPAYIRLYTKARVYRIPGYGWVWSHQCDHMVSNVSPAGLPSQVHAFRRAWNHMRRCV